MINDSLTRPRLSSYTGTKLVLPNTLAGLMPLRKSRAKQVLNDQVEMIHLQLWPEEDYRKLFEALKNEDAVEGSLIADDMKAAFALRQKAKEMGNTFVADQKLDTLRRSMNVVLRRYGLTRRERIEMKEHMRD